MNRQVALKQFGEAERPWEQTCVSTIERERMFTYGFPEPQTFIEFETMIFWDDHELDGVYVTTYSEAKALLAHAELIARVDAALLALVSTY